MRCSQKWPKGMVVSSLMGRVTLRETVAPGGLRVKPQGRTAGRYHPRTGKLANSLAFKAPTWAKSPMNALSVGKPSAGNLTSLPMNEPTQEKNTTNATNVERALVTAQTLVDTKQLTLERSPTSAGIAGRALAGAPIS